MPISHKPDLNVHFIHLRFSSGFSPVNKTVLIFALQKQSWSREDIKDLLGFTGSNQVEQMGMKHTSEIPSHCWLPRHLPGLPATREPPSHPGLLLEGHWLWAQHSSNFCPSADHCWRAQWGVPWALLVPMCALLGQWVLTSRSLPLWVFESSQALTKEIT